MTPAWGLAENVTIATALRSRHAAYSSGSIAAVSPPTKWRARAVGRRAKASLGCHRQAACRIAQVEIRDRPGTPCRIGTSGAVWLASNSLFAGYHGESRAHRRVCWSTAGSTRATGATLPGGDLFFVSRDKDLIVYRRREVCAARRRERVINRVAGVREGCVVAFGIVSHERGTEDLVAVVETRETDAAARARLQAAIRVEVHRATGLGVRHVILVPPGGIEKTTSGKLARRATQDRYIDQLTGDTSDERAG